MGLCFMSSIGKKTKIPTPVCDALITIASSMHRTNYFKTGRTLKELGIEEYSLDELTNILQDGF